MLAAVAKKLVVDAVVAKRFVLVAEVVVARVAIISVRPLSIARLLRVVVAASAVSNLFCVQKRFVASIRPEVFATRLDAKRLVVDAVVAKRFVVVAAVVVERVMLLKI